MSDERNKLLREALLAQAALAQQELKSENQAVDSMAPKADPVGYVAPDSDPEQGPTNLRGEFSAPGFDLASDASLQGGGLVDVPDQMALYSEDGLQVPIPQIVQQVLEFAGDFGAFAGGVTTGSMGYIVGGMADIAVKAGMSERGARLLAKDIMAAPDAFAGMLGTVTKPKNLSRSKYNQTVKTFTDAEKKALIEAGDNLPGMAPDVNTIQLTPLELGTLLQQASKGGRSSQAAVEKLAKEARTNPEAAAAAARLGIVLPPDVLSDNPLLKNAASMTRDVKSSEAAAQFESIVIDASKAADEAMVAIEGSPDLSSVSDQILTSMKSSQSTLKTTAAKIYKEVDSQIAPSTLATPNNTVRLLNNLIEDLGGIDNLSSNEKLIFNKLTNQDNPLTYAALVRLKQDIGRGMKNGQGPYGDVNQRALKRMYGALSEDQLLTAEEVGGVWLRGRLRLANQTTAKQKALEKRIVTSFGEDLDGSIASQLRLAITSGSRGDIKKLNKVLKAIPEDLQKEAIATAINALSLPGGASDLPFGFAEFAKTMKGLKKEKAVFKKIVSVLGPDSEQFLNDLLIISQRITEARGRVSQTGKANQANQAKISEGLTAENIAERIYNSTFGRMAVRGVAGSAGFGGGGPAGAMAADAVADVILNIGQKNKVKAAGELLNSSAFKSLVDADFAANQFVFQTALNKLESSPAYKRWLKSVEMTPSAGRILLQTSVVAGADGQIAPPVAEEPVEEVDVSTSPALQSLIETTDPSLLNQP